MAANIFQNPNATFGDRLLTGGYMVAWGGAHAALVAGLAVLGKVEIVDRINNLAAPAFEGGGPDVSSTLQVVNAESQGPVSPFDVTVLGKNPNYGNLGNDICANTLNDPNWTPQMNNDYMNSVISNQNFVVGSDPWPSTGIYQEEGQQLIDNGYNYSAPFFIPPTFGP
jgi:hypothetical protein